VVPITDRPEGRRGPPEPGPADPGGSEHRSEPTEQEVREEISREIHEIYEDSYGRGAGTCETFLGDGWVIVVLGQLELLPNEEFLVGNGNRDVVAHVRTQYQHAIQAPLRAAVERATGRSVTGFASATSVEEPRFATEIFKLD
jgi:uncharacterized protein YbcI